MDYLFIDIKLNCESVHPSEFLKIIGRWQTTINHYLVTGDTSNLSLFKIKTPLKCLNKYFLTC